MFASYWFFIFSFDFSKIVTVMTHELLGCKRTAWKPKGLFQTKKEEAIRAIRSLGTSTTYQSHD
jgi:hypothetical protein